MSGFVVLVIVWAISTPLLSPGRRRCRSPLLPSAAEPAPRSGVWSVGARHGWDERPVPGARLAAFWLAYGRSDDVVVTTLMRDLGLDDADAHDAVDQAKAWLGEDA